jgi:hypothetical protein
VKGSNLTPAEVDGNFTDLDGRVSDIEDAPIVGVPPSNITLVGTQLTFYYPDSLTFGPFTVPQANFRPSIGVDIDADTDGTFTVTSAHANHYLRYAGGSSLTIIFPGDLAADTEVTFRQVGAGPILFPSTTDVQVNGMEGFLNQTAGQGSTVTAKVVPAGGEWDLIGRLAEDVTA